MATPLAGRGLANQRRARQARNQPVYISGIKGQHSLETGVAYYYRGHHIYSAAAANPIDPIPFSTRKGISVVGIAQHLAPLYAPQAADLVPEASIAALDRARRYTLADIQAQEEAMRAEKVIALQGEEEKKSGNAAGVSSNAPVIGTVTAPSTPAMTVFNSFSPLSPIRPHLHSFTPHDRAQFLATSAPASRHVSVTNTPYGPMEKRRKTVVCRLVGWALGHRNVLERASNTHSPDPHLGNTSRRTSEQDLTRGTSSDTRPFHPPTAPAALRACERRKTPGPSAAFSTAHSSRTSTPFPTLTTSNNNLLYLPGLGQTTRQNLPTRPRISSASRPHAASLALNTAYNAANSRNTTEDTTTSPPGAYIPKCPIHDEDCDGETVTHVHQTERVRRKRGFKDVYPMISVNGRMMIDWAKIRDEEVAKRKEG
ncbi:hypothetical protein T440DRAFT_488295 [Plenodomus tracheiphilus IPT5]|uniref:Uncharacterized protein n=1 Tax=Plenodomus tracheiphilus IPT5 TaxID=1408161 RepID=A0A6A7BBR2_9PLEO|nr:hypothetical protein T440DRAFT_488295 [Plenodomus tracheiphilus IPT5]